MPRFYIDEDGNIQDHDDPVCASVREYMYLTDKELDKSIELFSKGKGMEDAAYLRKLQAERGFRTIYPDNKPIPEKR